MLYSEFFFLPVQSIWNTRLSINIKGFFIGEKIYHNLVVKPAVSIIIFRSYSYSKKTTPPRITVDSL